MAVTISLGNLDVGGAVVELSTGTKYAIYLNTLGNLAIYKNIDGTPTLDNSDPATVVHGAGVIGWVHAAVDSGDDIHILCACTSEQTRDIAYCIYDTSAAQFGSWEEAANYTEAAPSNPGCNIAIDSSDKPRILFVDAVKMTGSTQDNVYYADKTGASWSSAEQVGARTTKTDSYREPKLTMCPSDDVEALSYFSTDGDPAYRRRNGTWNTEAVYSATNCKMYSVLCTTGDVVYRYYYNNANLYENNSDTSANSGLTYVGSAALSPANGTDRYLFYISGGDIYLTRNVGAGWVDQGAQQTGTYEVVIAEWAYNNENQSGEINYIFTNGSNVYYASFTLSATVEFTVLGAGVSSTTAIDLPVTRANTILGNAVSALTDIDLIVAGIIEFIVLGAGVSATTNIDLKLIKSFIVGGAGISNITNVNLTITRLITILANAISAATSIDLPVTREVTMPFLLPQGWTWQ
jgi:hypothetical protein